MRSPPTLFLALLTYCYLFLSWACPFLDPLSHPSRFVGVQLEAAAALFSVLTAEAAGMTKAPALMGAATAGGDSAAGAGRRPSTPVTRLPVPVLIAAARSLRTLARTSLSLERALVAKVGKDGRARLGGASASRLVRYLARQCDR